MDEITPPRAASFTTSFALSTWLKPGVFLFCLFPALRLVVLGFSGGLSANPIEFVIRSLGTSDAAAQTAAIALDMIRETDR
jgi:sulfoxide reductase heme-binding subunit YedZ